MTEQQPVLTFTTVDVAALSGAHLDRNVLIRDKDGWTHTGRLFTIEHRLGYGLAERPAQTMLGVRSEDGSRWLGHLPHGTTLDVADQ